MNRIWTVARREVKALLDHPMGYILLVVFVGVNAFLFFRQIQVVGLATLRPMLELLPWLLLFLVPAVTMRALAEDARSGTLEVVLAQPLTEVELVAGKYLGQVLFLLLWLGLTLAIPAGLALGADLQAGVIIAQYLGAGFLIAGLAAVGVWASSVTPNQITAFILAVAVTFLLILVGLDPLLVGLPPRLGAVAAAFGVLSHFESITRGLIDLRDLVYFLSLAAAFLSLAYFALLRRKLSPAGAAARRARLGTGLLVAGAVLIALATQPLSLRLDLTPGNAYTLARATKQLLGDLPDLVTLKLFASSELPPEIAVFRRDIQDLLRDYRSAGRGKVRLVVRDPATDTAAAREARSLGIPPVQFNVVGESQLTVKEGWLGIAVQHAGESRVIPVVRQTDDLEYRLTSEIRALVNPRKPVVGLLAVPEPAAGPAEIEALREELGRAYELRTVTLADSGAIPEEIAAIVAIGAPDTLVPAQVTRFNAFLDRGGSLLILAGGMTIREGPFASGRRVGWNALLRRYGVAIRSDMAYDLASNEHVALPASFGRLLLPYPLWTRALSTKAAPINAELDGLVVPWGSTIALDSAPAGAAVPLFTTSRAGGVERDFVVINPQRDFSRDSLAPRVLAALVNPLAADTAKLPRGRLVLVGSSEVAADRFVRSAPANLAFLLNAVDWLAQDEALIAIRAKNRTPPPLAFTSGLARGVARYGNLIGLPLLVIAAGTLRLVRRHRLTGRRYQPSGTLTAPEVA
ncbi:MAG TPA: Gldg family protein [Gemmatimonadales bacterium]|nr:Gldg family protein [Gemmatimonadales bacterium]